MFDTTQITKFQSGLDIENLSLFNINEDSLTIRDFNKLYRRHACNKKLISRKFVNKQFFVNDDYIDLRKILKIDQPANAYLVCQLESKSDQELALLVGSDDGIKIWLNNQLVLNANVARKIERYQHYLPVSLKKGMNFLLVKANNFKSDWRFLLDISSIAYAQERYVEYSVSNFLSNPILRENERLNINLELFKSSEPAYINILNSSNQIILNNELNFHTGETSVDVSTFPLGVYKCHVSIDGKKFQQSFFIGDENNYIINLRKRADIIQDRNDKVKINIDAAFIRYMHLLEPTSRKLSTYADERLWKKKVVSIIQSIESVLWHAESKNNPYKNLPGLYIKGYRSKIDRQVQHYLTYAPATVLNNESHPLVVMIPIRILDNLPFAKNLIISNISEIEKIQNLADNSNSIILWPSTRGNTEGSEIEITALLEAINNLRTDYNIDNDRIHLFGVCRGARRALLIAEKMPSLFCSLGLIAPITKNNVINTEKTDPLEMVTNLINIPIYLVHSDGDALISVSNSDKLFNQLREVHNDITYDRLSGYSHLCYPESSKKEIFKFFANQFKKHDIPKVSLSTRSLKYGRAYWLNVLNLNYGDKAEIAASEINNTIKITTKNINQFEILLNKLDFNKNSKLSVFVNDENYFNDFPGDTSIVINLRQSRLPDNYTGIKTSKIEGPISHIFADKFILVEGTNSENTNLKKQFNFFGNQWEKEFFGDCIIKPDCEINEADIATSHLIILGNSASNLIIQKVIDDLPLKICIDKIIIDGVEYIGNNLGFHLIYPNPLNKEKYIVILGTNNENCFNVSNFNFSTQIEYDYAIFKYNKFNRPIMFDSGCFNANWDISSD